MPRLLVDKFEVAHCEFEVFSVLILAFADVEAQTNDIVKIFDILVLITGDAIAIICALIVPLLITAEFRTHIDGYGRYRIGGSLVPIRRRSWYQSLVWRNNWFL